MMRVAVGGTSLESVAVTPERGCVSLGEVGEVSSDPLSICIDEVSVFNASTGLESKRTGDMAQDGDV